MKALKYLKTALIIALLTLPTSLLAFWASGNGNTDGPPNGTWVGPHWDVDWLTIVQSLPFI